MMDAGRHPNITLLTYSEVTSVSGYVGNFKVTIKKKPRYVNEDLCVGCLQCIDKCVFKNAKFSDEFNMGLNLRKPIYLPFPQATPQVVLIDPEKCLFLKSGKCKQSCAEACDRKAIDFVTTVMVSIQTSIRQWKWNALRVLQGQQVVKLSSAMAAIPRALVSSIV
jgi:heterodisulfide reductase subunit A